MLLRVPAEHRLFLREGIHQEIVALTLADPCEAHSITDKTEKPRVDCEHAWVENALSWNDVQRRPRERFPVGKKEEPNKPSEVGR